MEKNKKVTWLGKYIWLLCAFLHWTLSFWYERFIFKYDENSWDIFWSVSMDDRFDQSMQSTVLYIFGKLIALILICFLYYLIRIVIKSVKEKIFPLYVSIILGIFFAAFIFYFCIYWPASFAWDDSYMIYEFALRLVPWYWHHFLTSAWYVGCLMVFPHPLTMSLIQLLGFVAVMIWLFYKLGKSFKISYPIRFLILLICLVPATFWLVAQVYRNCIYAIILMFYIPFILFEEADKAELSPKKMFFICALSALLAVWRTEGILIGITGMVICLFKVYKVSTKRKIYAVLIFSVLFVFLGAPQKIGDIKYYGKDYFIVSTMEPVRNILNDEKVNISYKGAEDDLEAIDAYAPIECMRYRGIEEVRGYFYEQGHMDIDQSLAGKEVQSAYLKAFARLAIHNMGPYIKSQMNFMFKAIGADWKFQMGEYTGEHIPTKYDYSLYKLGAEDFYAAKGVYAYTNNRVYVSILNVVALLTFKYRTLMQNSGISTGICVFIILFDLFIVIRELIRLIRRKKGLSVSYFAFSLLLLIQFGLVTMTVPSYYSLYFYSVFYPCATMESIYIAKRINYLRKG